MSRTEYFDADSGTVYYVKPVPVSATPSWAADAIIGTPNPDDGREIEFAGLDEDIAYRIFERAGGSPLVTDAAVASIDPSRTDLVDEPNPTALAAIQSEVNDALVALDLDSALIAQGAERAVNVDNSHRVHSHVYDMQTNAITAQALAADAVAEIQSGLATKAELDAAQSSIEAACATVTTAQIISAIDGTTWTDEDGNAFNLTVAETA